MAINTYRFVFAGININEILKNIAPANHGSLSLGPIVVRDNGGNGLDQTVTIDIDVDDTSFEDLNETMNNFGYIFDSII